MTYEQDVEDRGAAGERTPMLGSSSTLLGSSLHQRRSREPSRDNESAVWSFMRFFGGGIYAPDPSTYDPIEILLNTEDEGQRDDLTVKWRDNKLSELSFVGVVSALLAGVLTSTGSWPNILPNGQVSPWTVRTSWYCGIILSLFSILTAADQTVRLHRISSHRDGLDNIRRLLSKKNGERGHSAKTGRQAPSMLQIMTWQMPVMFLTSATICMIVGMFLHVWSATTHLKHPEIWDDNTKVAIVYSVTAAAAIGIFFLGQVTLYSSIRR
ncbi:hypothetical protein T440DRAFT_385144 [Plenodomus tracheiphilus IPT5]|uniref:Uncharacterized protein n=1 Tax=Plenodomus tracheiphilus IPT5 TaxID=1408161 RepID=A0A6A7BKR6_9PLEO|nr:hypothetical protein T440DRAFT_385144 [Plenodomus tracheiphilus IPT5]